MNLTTRFGKAYEAFIGKNNKQQLSPKQKLTVGQLGGTFLDLSGMSQSEKKVSEKLLKSYEGWVYANVSVLAEEVSKIEFELFKTVNIKGELEWTPIDSHPLLDLLDRFNPFTTTSDAIYLTEAHLELAGDTFYLLDGLGSNINNIFILDPTKIEVIIGDANDEYMITGYKYRDVIDGKVTEEIYKPEQIIQIKNPNPSNPYRGKSVVEAAAMTIDTDNLAAEFLKNFFKNNATPGLVLTTDQRITRDDLERLQADLRKNYGGLRNAFKSLVLSGGLSPAAIQHSGKEMQFLELEQAMRDKIMALFKNTKASLGIVEDVNRANAEATILSWKQSVIKPKMQRITDTLNEFLVPRYGENLILGFKDPVPENRQAKIEEVVALYAEPTTPVITLNEARTMIGLNPLDSEDGDTIMNTVPRQSNQGQMMDEENIPKSIRNINHCKHIRRNRIKQLAQDNKELYDAAKKIAKTYIEKKNKSARPKSSIAPIFKSFSNDRIDNYYGKQIHLVDVIEERFHNRVISFLKQLEDKAISNLHANIVKGKKRKAFELFDQEQELEAGIDLFTPLMAELAAGAAAEAYQLLQEKSKYIPSEDLKDKIDTQVKLFTQSFLDTDREKLLDILKTGIDNGDSVAQIESAIRNQFSEFRKSQSERIARSELLRASNSASLDAYKQSGVVAAKQWLTDSDPCAYCAPLNGKIVDLEKNYFEKGDSWKGDAKVPVKLDYDDIGYPPLHPNCECTIVPVLDENTKMVKNSNELEELRQYSKELEKLLEIEDE